MTDSKETNNENVKDAEIMNPSNQSKELSNSINLNINFSDISQAIAIIKGCSIEDLKNILENSKYLQDNNFQSINKIIEEAKDLDLEKIELILEYIDKNTKEEHEHARKVQQENNRHDEAMTDRLLAAVLIIIAAAGVILGGMSLFNDNNDDSNKLK